MSEASVQVKTPVLEMRGVSIMAMKNPATIVAADVNWTVEAGEFWVVGAPQHSGKSDFLMTALHRTGFASQPTSTHRDDGLQLTDAYIASAVRCAPPDNKPTPDEIVNCLPHLFAEVAALPNLRAVVALGSIGYDAYLRLLRFQGMTVSPRPAFGHGSRHRLPNGITLIGCYHPSRQNTNTGRLTARMMAAVFRQVRRELNGN